MTTWLVTNRATGKVIYAYTAEEPTEWPGMEFAQHNHIREIPAEPVPPARRLTKLEMIGRMGESVFVAIMGMAKESVAVAAWVEMVRMATPDPDGTSIDLDDPRTLAGLQALEPALIAQGVVTDGWAAGVVA